MKRLEGQLEIGDFLYPNPKIEEKPVAKKKVKEDTPKKIWCIGCEKKFLEEEMDFTFFGVYDKDFLYNEVFPPYLYHGKVMYCKDCRKINDQLVHTKKGSCALCPTATSYLNLYTIGEEDGTIMHWIYPNSKRELGITKRRVSFHGDSMYCGQCTMYYYIATEKNSKFMYEVRNYKGMRNVFGTSNWSTVQEFFRNLKKTGKQEVTKDGTLKYQVRCGGMRGCNALQTYKQAKKDKKGKD